MSDEDLLARARASLAALDHAYQVDDTFDPEDDKMLRDASSVIDDLIFEVERLRAVKRTAEQADVWLQLVGGLLRSDIEGNIVGAADKLLAAFDERFRNKVST